MPGSCASGDLARESAHNLKKSPATSNNVRGHDLEVFWRRGKKQNSTVSRLGQIREAVFSLSAKSNRQAVTPIAVRQRRPARLEATLRLLKNRAEQEFVKAGGDPDDFEDAWDGGLKEKLLIERVSKFVTLPQPSLVRRIAAACIDRLDELRSECLTSGKSNHPGSKYGPALTANRPDQRAAAGTLGDSTCRASLNKA